MRLTREIHVGSKTVFGRAQELAPDMKLESSGETWLLGFADRTAEGGVSAHLFLLDQAGKEKLVRLLTGVILADSVPA